MIMPIILLTSRNFRPIYSANNPIGVSLLARQGWREASTLPRIPEKNDNPIGLVFHNHAKMYQYENKIIQKKPRFHRIFGYKNAE